VSGGRGIAAGAFAAQLFLACTPAAAPGASAPAQPSAAIEPSAAATDSHAQSALHAPAQAAEPQRAGAGEAELFGAPIDPSTPEIELAALLAAPEQHAGKTVRTQGTVSRVCQAAGCWMELRDDASGASVRTPMAGHAFFLPQRAVGKHAAIEGVVQLRPLSVAQKQHLEAEGAQATASALSIAATGVALR